MIVALLGYLAYSAFAWWVVFWDGAEVLEGWKSSLFLDWSAFVLTADEIRIGVAISWIATSIIGLATYFSN